MSRLIYCESKIRTSKLQIFIKDNLFDYLSCSETTDDVSSRSSSQINSLLLKNMNYVKKVNLKFLSVEKIKVSE